MIDALGRVVEVERHDARELRLPFLPEQAPEMMPETQEELDSAVRMAAFVFLDDRLLGVAEETLPFDLLRRGFTFRGRRVPMLGPQGIFKPAVLPDVPLTIVTAPPKKGKPVPYDDMPGPDGSLLYRYRGKDPMHHENVGLRKAMTRGRLSSISEGSYRAAIFRSGPYTW